MNRIVATMDDLPELPFEKVLSYLNLEDRLRSRAVSRRWYHKINSFNKVKSLCYSSGPSDFIFGKGRWVSGSFARNFIGSTRFDSFFSTFGHSTLSNLMHLRLCDLRLNEENGIEFAQALQSLGQLQELDLIRFSYLNRKLDLNLPMLNSIQLKEVREVPKLTLDSPKLKSVKLMECSVLRLNIVHTQSVERLLTDSMAYLSVRKLENLTVLYSATTCDMTLVFQLRRLRKYRLCDPMGTIGLFDMKPASKGGLGMNLILLIQPLLDDHLAMDPLEFKNLERNFRNWTALFEPTDEIPFYRSIRYTAIERVDPDLANFVKLFTDLERMHVEEPVQNIERFLDFLKTFENIVDLVFTCDQPQDLFDRLPEHCAVQYLMINCAPLELGFLWRLKNLMRLQLAFSVDAESIRKILEELELLTWFGFQHDGCGVEIQIDLPKQFNVLVAGKTVTVADVDAVIQLITGK